MLVNVIVLEILVNPPIQGGCKIRWVAANLTVDFLSIQRSVYSRGYIPTKIEILLKKRRVCNVPIVHYAGCDIQKSQSG